MHNLNDTNTVLDTLIEDILAIAEQYPELPNSIEQFNPIKEQFLRAYQKAAPELRHEVDTLSNTAIRNILGWDHSQHTIQELIDFLIGQLQDKLHFDNDAYTGQKYQDELTSPSPLYKKIFDKIQSKFAALYTEYDKHDDIDNFKKLFKQFIQEFSNAKNHDEHAIERIFNLENQTDDKFYKEIDYHMLCYTGYWNLREHFKIDHFLPDNPFHEVASVVADQEYSLSQASMFHQPSHLLVSGSIGATFGIVATLAYTVFALNPVFLTAMGVGLVAFLLASLCTELYMQTTAPTPEI